MRRSCGPISVKSRGARNASAAGLCAGTESRRQPPNSSRWRGPANWSVAEGRWPKRGLGALSIGLIGQARQQLEERVAGANSCRARLLLLVLDEAREDDFALARHGPADEPAPAMRHIERAVRTTR